MNKSRISPDDPRLTAYALGELEAAELAEVEAALTADPAAQAIVAEIRIAADQLTAALAGETAETAAKPGSEETTRRRRRLGARRGRWLAYLSVGGLAAACVAALLISERSPPPIRNSGEAEALAAFGPSAATEGAFNRFSGALALAARQAPPGKISTNAPAQAATGFAVPLPSPPPTLGGSASLSATEGGPKAKFVPGRGEDTTVAMNDDIAAAAAVAGHGYAQGVGGEIRGRFDNTPGGVDFTVLARAPAAKNELNGGITIAIDQDGGISLNGKNVSKVQLFVLLKQVAQVHSGIPVLILAHESSQIKTLAFVMDACRQAHLNRFSLQSR